MDIASIKKNINITSSPQLQVNSKNNPAVLAVLLLLGCGAITWFLVLPKSAQVKAQQTQKDSLAIQESQLSTQLKNLQKLVVEVKDNEDNNARLDESIPLNGKTFDLQGAIQNLAASVGVSIDNLNLNNTNQSVIAGDVDLLKNPYGSARTLQTISGSLFVTGSFSQLEAFLKKIENSNRLMDITSMEINTDKSGQLLSLKIEINAYYLAP